VTDEDMEGPRWYRFNDTVVDEFVMNDDALAAECFGGTYKSKATDGSKYFYTVKQQHSTLYVITSVQLYGDKGSLLECLHVILLS